MMRILALLGIAVALLSPAAAQQRDRPAGARQPRQQSACTMVPARPFDIILGRPTSNSVTASVLVYSDAEGCIAYGREADGLREQTPRVRFPKGQPVDVVLSGLQPDSAYKYQLQLAGTNSAEFAFHTARPPGSAFTFTITADSHLDEQTDPSVYQQTLANALAAQPDFHIDLGDTFMSEKHASRENAAAQYLAQRYYFGQLCASTPLFLVLGNHDGETPLGRGPSPGDLALWSNTTRKRYFPNPVPDGFYTGDAVPDPRAGLLQDYYAWEWGDGLFVVLDPFWFSGKSRGSNWASTLGAEQYAWLKRTLEKSHARYKFVFIHNLVGGLDSQGRGGTEAAPLYEWGGHNADGSDGFAQNRPGLAAPIHQLLVRNKVAAVFHGHDHLYARQELDGVIYQAVPQPGFPGNGKPPRSAAEYGYVSGKILGSSGCLRVRISPAQATIDYVQLCNGKVTIISPDPFTNHGN